MEIEEEKTKKLKYLLNKNKSETISREEVDHMIKKSSLCLSSNVLAISVSAKPKQLKISSNVYFLSENFQQKNSIPSKKELANEGKAEKTEKKRSDSQIVINEELDNMTFSNTTTKRSLKKEEVTERNALKEMPVTS